MSKWLGAGLISVAMALVAAAIVVSTFAIPFDHGWSWQAVLAIPETGPLAQSNEDRTVSVSGPPTLSVTNTAGSVRVRPGASALIVVHAIKRAADEQSLPDLELKVDQNGDRISITTVFSGSRGLTFRRMPTVDLDVESPATIESLSIDSRLGPTNVERLTGRLNVHGAFGAITVTGQDGTAILQNANGQVNVMDGRGSLRVENAFGAIRVERQQGDMNIANANGKIQVIDARGSVQVKNRFGAIELRGVDSLGLDVQGENGAVHFDGTLSSGSENRLTCTFGSIELQIPTSSNVRLDATTAFGQVAVNFALTDSETNRDAHRIVGVKGTVGRADGSLVVHAQNGNITITPKDR